MAATVSICRAQALEAQVTVLSVAPARVKVKGRRRVPVTSWSFRNAYAGVLGLGERIENLILLDERGSTVPVRKLAAGEYEAERAAVGWSCEFRLDAPASATDAAYHSWLTGERGFLMLGDLLPRLLDGQTLASDQRARVNLVLPARWTALTSEMRLDGSRFEVADVPDAVFYIGADLRERRARVGAMEFTLASSGGWAFSEQDALNMAADILKDFTKRVGPTTRTRAVLMLAPFPQQVGAERWSAETRGGTVVLLSGRSPSKVAALAQLNVPLTHELFHLWVPNGLQLKGNYDWFYEGFTSYQGLTAGVRLRFLSFEDYLNVLARAYDRYLASSDRQKFSLLEAARRRWRGADGLVYQKGLLVAFLYDVMLRQASQGKQTLDDAYRQLFEPARARAALDGNEAVLAALSGPAAMREFVRRYIEGTDEIDLKSLLAPLGLKVERQGARTQIFVGEKLSRPQRDLWRAFEYNERAQRPRRNNS